MISILLRSQNDGDFFLGLFSGIWENAWGLHFDFNCNRELREDADTVDGVVSKLLNIVHELAKLRLKLLGTYFVFLESRDTLMWAVEIVMSIALSQMIIEVDTWWPIFCNWWRLRLFYHWYQLLDVLVILKAIGLDFYLLLWGVLINSRHGNLITCLWF